MPAVRLAAGFAAAALSLSVIGWLASGGNAALTAGFDESFRQAMRSIGTEPLTAAFRAITRLGSTLYLSIVGSAAVVVFAFLGWRRAIWLFLIAMAGQIVLHHGFKAIFQRIRPEPFFDYDIGDSYSFPSGHALASMAVYGTLAVLVIHRIRSPLPKAAIAVAAAVLVVLIGMSRLYFGVHHATDVLAGFTAAVIWVAAIASVDDPSRELQYLPAKE